jgi:DNA-binding CsgD family transcriptional regulator
MNIRQERIIRLLAAGKTYKQIADELRISQPTLRTAVNRAKATLGARTTYQAVALYSGLKLSDDNGWD